MKTGLTDLKIRTAIAGDAAAVDSMVDEFRLYLHGLGDFEACVNFGGEQFRRDGFGADPAFSGLIAELNGEAVGYALYAFDYSTDSGSRGIYLHDLFVRGSQRGKGIGEALMTQLAEICRNSGGAWMAWHVWHSNESAIRFYQKMGARTVDTVRLMRLSV